MPLRESKLRVGVLGAGVWAGRAHVPGWLRDPRCEVVAIADVELDRAQALAEESGVSEATTDWLSIIQRADIDAIDIATPSATHLELAMAAIEAGKHVLCEKPLSRRAADVEQMVAACEAAGVLLMEAFMFRHHPQHARVRELLAAGAIGEPAIVRASFAFAMPPARRALPDVRVQSGLDGGAFMDVGCYALNAARFLFDAEPLEVTALQRRDPLLNVDTSFAAVARFPGDRLALLDGSFDANGPSRYEITGFEGSILVERAYQPERQPSQITIVRGGERRTEEIAGTDQYGIEADHFARSVRVGHLLLPAENGLAQARAVEAMYRSAETGQSVRLA